VKRALLSCFCLFIALSRPVAAAAQEAATNPLAELNEELKAALAEGGVPFSDAQEKAVTLMMEERRRASEELFGDLMDFRSGPTQGQEADRLKSAIEWMQSEFLNSLSEYLTEPQARVWSGRRRPGLTRGRTTPSAPVTPEPSQTQFVRINANGFTAEDSGFSVSGSGTEVIQRGGVGAWHGNGQFLLKDDALNARNAFASNKPPYQERRVSIDASGPAIRGRLTSAVSFNQNESENVGTIRATLPDGVFALGITRPNTYRNFETTQTLQIAAAHSLRAFGRLAHETARDQGIGGFSLPERAYDGQYRESNAGSRLFSAPGSHSLFEARVQVNRQHYQQIPRTDGVRINVLDAFSAGGAQNRSEDRNQQVEFGTMYTRIGDTVLLKTGVEGNHRHEISDSTSNFGGTYTFSSLEAYLAGTPATYRVTVGNPLVDTAQLEVAGFVQSDLKVTSRLMVMLGTRYEIQQNLADHNNLAPRISMAYSPSQATVLRAGGGIFYNRFGVGTVENQRRFDGTRQYEIVIDNPSYPDPSAAGSLRTTLPSVRVTDPDLVAPYYAIGMVSLERTFLSNLLITAAYDVQRQHHKLRTRNLNAPYDASRPGPPRACSPATPEDACVKPDLSRGNIINLESTGNDTRHTARVSVRKRFGVLNASLNYQFQRQYGDVNGGDGSAATDSYDVRADRGNSPNPHHNINSSVNARLPLGLFLTGNMSFNSRRYYTLTTGNDDNRDSNVNDRPAGVPPNTLEGPRYLNVDFNVSKAFFLGRTNGNSGTNANVFLNLTNAFNHVHYGTPSGVMTSPNFGQSTSANDPREIEAGVRFQF
jgi:hypothetical protein